MGGPAIVLKQPCKAQHCVRSAVSTKVGSLYPTVMAYWGMPYYRRPKLVPMPPEGSWVNFKKTVTCAPFIDYGPSARPARIAKGVTIHKNSIGKVMGIGKQKRRGGTRLILILLVDGSLYQISLRSPKWLPHCLQLMP